MGKDAKKIIFIEDGFQQYTQEKMQSAQIFMRILKNNDSLGQDVKNIDLVKSAIKFNKTGITYCYIVGSDEFTKTVKSVIAERGLKWKINTECSNEDEAMKSMKISFPKTVKTYTKIQNNKSNSLYDENTRLYDTARKHGISDEDIAGIIFAADELKTMRIFPETKENVYKAFLNIAQIYIQNKEVAQNAVEIYLETSISH